MNRALDVVDNSTTFAELTMSSSAAPPPSCFQDAFDDLVTTHANYSPNFPRLWKGGMRLGPGRDLLHPELSSAACVLAIPQIAFVATVRYCSHPKWHQRF